MNAMRSTIGRDILAVYKVPDCDKHIQTIKWHLSDKSNEETVHSKLTKKTIHNSLVMIKISP